MAAMKKKKLPPEFLEYQRELGRQGGKKGSAMLTKQQRIERARKAVQARWAKKRKGD